MQVRPRTIQPGYGGHWGLYQLEERTGLPILLSYALLWGCCDRSGRFEWKPDELKRNTVPHHRCDMRDVLRALEESLHVVRYQVAGRWYGWLPTLTVHQPINVRETASKLPPPPRVVVAWYQRAIEAQNVGEPFPEPNPLRETEPAQASLWGSGTASAGALSRSTPGALPVSASNGKLLQSGSREPDPSGTSQPERAGSPDAPGFAVVVSSEEGSSEERRARDLDGEREGEAGDGSGRRGELVKGNGASAHPLELDPLASRRTQALPAIRGKRDVAAIVTRLAQVLEEVTSGSREPLGREQWLTLATEMVFGYWAKSHGKDKAFIGENDVREKKVKQRLLENRGDIGELCYAIDGVKRSKYHMGDNPDRRTYDGLETILRDRPQVEKFAALVPEYRAGKLHPMVRKYAQTLTGMAGAPQHLHQQIQDDAAEQPGDNGGSE